MALIRKLAGDHTQRFTVIFDGHNYLDPVNKIFVSSYAEKKVENLGDMPKLVALEINMVSKIQNFASQEGYPNITILNQVPCSMAKSLISAAYCNYFISLWGAGLAKYKWIGNAEGMILSSRAVLSKKGDIRIYDTPEFLEDAVAADYYPYEHVQDLDDTNSEIQTGQVSRSNFDIDPEVFANYAFSLIKKRLPHK